MSLSPVPSYESHRSALRANINAPRIMGSDHRWFSDRQPNARSILRDIIIGFSDGLTVPFALTAGLSSLGSSRLVVIGGLAELLSGAISMGMGAYLAALTDRDRYICQERSVEQDITRGQGNELSDIIMILRDYGVRREVSEGVVTCLRAEDTLIKFIMQFKFNYRKPKRSRAWFSAITMGFSYLIGGLLPMIPYFVTNGVTRALFISIGITAVILLLFGFFKNYIALKTPRSGVFGAIQTLSVGAIAAGASYGVVYGVDRSNIH